MKAKIVICCVIILALLIFAQRPTREERVLTRQCVVASEGKLNHNQCRIWARYEARKQK